MHADPGPQLIECMTLRLHGHAVYDKGEYVPDELMQKWRSQDPLPAARRKLQEICGFSEDAIATLESRVEEEIQEALNSALRLRPARRRPAKLVGLRARRRNQTRAVPSAAGQKRRGRQSGARLSARPRSARRF